MGLNACLQQPIRYSPFTVHAKLAYKDQLIRTLCKCNSFWSLGTLWKVLCLFFTDCNTVKSFQLQTHSMAETSKRQLITLTTIIVRCLVATSDAGLGIYVLKMLDLEGLGSK